MGEIPGQTPRITKKWDNVAVEIKSIEAFQAHDKVQGLWRFRPEAWYERGLPIYVKVKPVAGAVYELQLREKDGREYLFLKPVQDTEIKNALIIMDSGDLWRSSYSCKVIRGKGEVVSHASGGSRGGAHWREVEVYIAEIGSVFEVYNAGFKGRYPKTKAMKVLLEEVYVYEKDGELQHTPSHLVEYDWIREEIEKYKARLVTAPMLRDIGDVEDFLVAEEEV